MANRKLVNSKLDDLREVSALLGADPQLVQASTGNTSIKIEDTLFIKASGKWLSDAQSDDFFVGVDLRAARQCVERGEEVPNSAVMWGCSRPSIETAMHAVLPHPVVIHVHSVNAIAWAVRKDGPREIGRLLKGLKWAWIPYTASGVSLARQIRRVVSFEPETDVFVLANHGLVVCGSSCLLTERLLRDVELRLHIQGRPSPEPDWCELKRIMPERDWVLPASVEVHALARDREARHLLSLGALYPCQVMFLPDTIPTLSFPIQEFGSIDRPRQMLFTDAGVLCHESVTPAQQILLYALAEVVRRIDPAAPVRYLTHSEISGVLNGFRYSGASLNDLPEQAAVSAALLR